MKQSREQPWLRAFATALPRGSVPDMDAACRPSTGLIRPPTLARLFAACHPWRGWRGSEAGLPLRHMAISPASTGAAQVRPDPEPGPPAPPQRPARPSASRLRVLAAVRTARSGSWPRSCLCVPKATAQGSAHVRFQAVQVARPPVACIRSHMMVGDMVFTTASLPKPGCHFRAIPNALPDRPAPGQVVVPFRASRWAN